MTETIHIFLNIIYYNSKCIPGDFAYFKWNEMKEEEKTQRSIWEVHCHAYSRIEANRSKVNYNAQQ